MRPFLSGSVGAPQIINEQLSVAPGVSDIMTQPAPISPLPTQAVRLQLQGWPRHKHRHLALSERLPKDYVRRAIWPSAIVVAAGHVTGDVIFEQRWAMSRDGPECHVRLI